MLGWIREYFADNALGNSFLVCGRRCDRIAVGGIFVQQRPVRRELLAIALPVVDDLVTESVRGAVAKNRIGKQREPFLDPPVGGDGKAGGAVLGDDQLVEIMRLLLGKPLQSEIVKGSAGLGTDMTGRSSPDSRPAWTGPCRGRSCRLWRSGPGNLP